MEDYSKAIQGIIRRKRKYIRRFELKRIPFNIILLMLEEQYKQTGKVDILKFQRFLACSASQGGFDWDKSLQGYKWWFNTLRKYAPHAINKL